MQLREKKVGAYTVRELPMRETMRVLKELPGKDAENQDERGAAMLGASVFDANGKALGVGVLDLGTGIYQALMAAHDEVNSPPDFEGEPGNA